jgi:redox-sensitive bicupin YhaK (pirin superfamily)
MIEVRKSKERGYEDKGWLKTYHTFSFDTYYDPDFMGYRTIRVINEDRVRGGKGFGTHFHKDMEILTYVIAGAIEHKDSLGNTGLISAGECQRMTAGSGIQHSEYNLSHEVEAHFLQIWILPNQNGLTPDYSQKSFSSASKWGQWCLIASNNGRGGSLIIHQDVDLYSTILDKDDELTFEGLSDRYYWVQVISGSFLVGNQTLHAGDAAAINDTLSLQFKALEGGEVLLFDLA